MIYWAPFLHFYQPPTQFHAVLEKICNESYRPLIKMFSEQPNAKVTVNICGVLTEMFKDHGARDIIEGIKGLAEADKLEFVESGKYHPILTLIPPKEIHRQVELNRKANSYFFKNAYKVRGFFSPEMCYSNELASILSSMGYEWTLVSGSACAAEWPLDVIYRVPVGRNNMLVFFRDDIISNKISFRGIESKKFISEMVNLSEGKRDIYVITAMDAETFGHHIQNWEKLFLADVYETIENGKNGLGKIERKADLVEAHEAILGDEAQGEVKAVTISELLKLFTIKNSKPPLPSSWSTTTDDIKKNNYYPLWKNPDNPIHTLQWKHVDICLEVVGTAVSIKDNEAAARFASIARALLDRAMHSCQFWWANKNRMWDINMVNKGLLMQQESVFNAYKAIYVSSAKADVKNDAYFKYLAAKEISGKIQELLVTT